MGFGHGSVRRKRGNVQPGDNVYRGAVIRISELAGKRRVHEGCDLKGPAVLVTQGSSFVEANLVGDPDTLLWAILPTAPR